MKIPSDDLFLLIKSLSKTEKRYFRLYAQNSVSLKKRPYVKLFDAIGRQKDYNESVLKHKEIVPVKNLKKAKWRLSAIILKSMDIYYSASIFDAGFKSQFKNIYVLYQKALYNQCSKNIVKLKKQLLFYERYSEIIELSRFEKRLPTGKNTQIKESYAIEKEAINSLALEIELQYLSDTIYQITEINERVRDEKNIRKIRELSRNPLLNRGAAPRSFRGLYYYYSAKGFCHSALGQHKECYKYRKNQIKLIEKNSHQINQYPELNIAAIHNFLISCFFTGHRSEYYLYLKKLKKMEAHYNKSGNKRMAISLFSVTANQETSTISVLCNFHKINDLIPELEEKIKRYGNGVNINILLTLYYNIAYNLFGTGNYSKTLVWINKIINHPNVEVRQDVQVFAKILNLIVHYEMGNAELLTYINRSAFRFVNKKGRLYKYESNVLEFMKKLSLIVDKKELNELYKTFRKKLFILSTDPTEKFAFEGFDIISWIESKIENRPFAEILREKAKTIVGSYSR